MDIPVYVLTFQQARMMLYQIKRKKKEKEKEKEEDEEEEKRRRYTYSRGNNFFSKGEVLGQRAPNRLSLWRALG